MWRKRRSTKARPPSSPQLTCAIRGMMATTVSSTAAISIASSTLRNAWGVRSPASTSAGPASATDSSNRRFSSPRAKAGWLNAISGDEKPAAITI